MSSDKFSPTAGNSMKPDKGPCLLAVIIIVIKSCGTGAIKQMTFLSHFQRKKSGNYFPQDNFLAHDKARLEMKNTTTCITAFGRSVQFLHCK